LKPGRKGEANPFSAPLLRQFINRIGPAANLQDQTQVNKRVRRLTLINSIIGISIAGLSTRIFMISVPTLATALGTDILGISWALIVYQVAGIGLGVVCGRLGDIYGHHKL